MEVRRFKKRNYLTTDSQESRPQETPIL